MRCYICDKGFQMSYVKNKQNNIYYFYVCSECMERLGFIDLTYDSEKLNHLEKLENSFKSNKDQLVLQLLQKLQVLDKRAIGHAFIRYSKPYYCGFCKRNHRVKPNSVWERHVNRLDLTKLTDRDRDLIRMSFLDYIKKEDEYFSKIISRKETKQLVEKIIDIYQED